MQQLTAAGFETTQWTLVQALHDPSHPRHQEAGQTLPARYWPAIYSWFRRHGNDQDRAADATQAFFAHVILSRNLFERADRDRAPLRSLLLTALRNFRIDEIRAGKADIGWAGIPEDQLLREEMRLNGNSSETSDQAFERRWAIAVLREAVRRCEEHYRHSKRQNYWKVFEACLLRPTVSGNARPPLAQLAKEFGFTDANHAAVAIYTVRAQCQTMLRQVATETAATPQDAEAELDVIKALLG